MYRERAWVYMECVGVYRERVGVYRIYVGGYRDCVVYRELEEDCYGCGV